MDVVEKGLHIGEKYFDKIPGVSEFSQAKVSKW